MKIDPLSQIRRPAAPRKERSGDTGAGGFAEALGGDKETATISGGGPLGGVEALLSLQEVPDATTGRGRARERGEAMLDALEELRVALLAGQVPLERLQQLSQMLSARMAKVDDPRLAEILAEIEVRAAVELAEAVENVCSEAGLGVRS